MDGLSVSLLAFVDVNDELLACSARDGAGLSLEVPACDLHLVFDSERVQPTYCLYWA